MNKLVFLDVDDTLLSPPYAAIARLCRLIGKKLPPEQAFLDRKHIHFHQAFPEVFRTAKEMWALVLLALPFGYFRSQKPLSFELSSMARVLSDHRVYLVSKNPPSFTRWRIKRLQEIFGVSVGDRYIACGPMFQKGKTKSEIIRAIAQEREVSLEDCLLVDDSLDNIREVAPYRIKTLAVRASWNAAEMQVDAAKASPDFLPIATEEIADAVEDFLGGALEKDTVSVFLVPPLTVFGALRLFGSFLRRFWLYDERVPRRDQIIPVARRRFTSLFYADPHQKARRKIRGLLAQGAPIHSLRLIASKKSQQTSLLPLRLREVSSFADKDKKVHALRELARRSLEQNAVRLGPSAFYHFYAMSRPTEILRVLSADRVQKALTDYTETHKVSMEDAKKMARRYAQQITAGRTYLGCFVTVCLLASVIKKLFRSVSIETHPQIAALEKDYFLIYASTHRSYLDSGILYRALAAHRGSLPFVVAAEKMRRVWIGKLGLVAGAVFLQRRFVDGIYAAILAEHIAHMQVRGSSLEIFLEGQRSRSGLTLPPKKGIASIIWQNLDSDDARKSEVAIVPVSFAYNKLPESELLLRESFEERKQLGRVSLREVSDISLKAKRRKSKGAKLRSVWRRLRSKAISDCHIRFGEPIIMSRDSSLDATADMGRLQATLNEAMFSINKSTAILRSSLLCLATLSAPENHLSREGAEKFLRLHDDLLALYDLPFALSKFSQEDISAQITDFISLPFVNRKFKRYQVDEQQVLSISDLDIERASYYKNNVLHFFVLPAILSYVLADVGTGRIEELERFFGHTFEKMQIQYFLPTPHSPKSFIRALLAIFAKWDLVDLQKASYTVNKEADNAPLFRSLAYVGTQLAEVDLPDLLSNFRRLHQRFDVSLPVTIASYVRDALGPASLTCFEEGTFFIATSHALLADDELSFVSENGQTVVGQATEIQVDGAIVRQAVSKSARDGGGQEFASGQKVPGKLSLRRQIGDLGEINNLSASGAFLRTNASLQEGDLLTCTMKDGDACLQLTARVSRRTQAGVGIQFKEMSDTTRIRLLFLSEPISTTLPVQAQA